MAGVVGGFFVWGKDLLKSTSEKVVETATYQNIGRNYMLVLPTDFWPKDDASKRAGGYDLAFKEPGGEAMVAVLSTFAVKSAPKLEYLADATLKDWQGEMDGLEQTPGTSLEVAGVPALKVIGHGKYNGASDRLRREAVVLFNEGINYRIVFTAPEESFDSHERMFAAVLERFRFIGPRPNWEAEMEAASDLEVIASREHPYLLKAPRGQWKVNPDLPASRFADLKLTNKTKTADLVIIVRTNATTADVKDRYIAVQKNPRQGNAKAEVAGEENNLRVAGMPALRLDMNIEDSVGTKAAVWSTFVQAETTVYQLEFRVDEKKAEEFRPVYADLVRRFELLDEILPQKEPEPKAIAQAAPAEAEKKAETEVVVAKASPKGASATPDGMENPASERPPAKAVASAAPKTADAKKPESLDDLDDVPKKSTAAKTADTKAAAGKPAESKVAKTPSKEEPAAPGSTKKKRISVLEEPDEDEAEDAAAASESKSDLEKPKPSRSKPAKTKKAGSLDDLD